MKSSLLTLLLLASALPGLTACGESRPTGSGNMTMRDMEVVDGTANDSMADLDNTVADGTAMANIAASSPSGVQGTESTVGGNKADAPTTSDDRGAATAATNSSSAAE